MKIAKSLFWLFFITVFCTGFRTYGGIDGWDISRSSAALSKIFFVFPEDSRAVTNDLPSSDPLSSAGATITVDQMMTSIFDDFNNIDAAFVTLANDSDSDFAANQVDRTITVEFGDGGGGSQLGNAEFSVDGGKIIDCDISMANSTLNSAKEFVQVMTHEIGHCLGLDHPQDTVNALMSYFYDSSDVVRLQIDDKMGVVHLYPTDPSAAEEKSTFGFSCSRN